MLEIVILSIALSMDAFAVSIVLAAKHKKEVKNLAWMAGAYFGLFQGAMPLIGFFVAKAVTLWMDTFADRIAFILLLTIGIKMIVESFDKSEKVDLVKISHRVMILLAIATSIDAMVAGFTLVLLEVNFVLACLIIGLTTVLFSTLGVLIGKRFGASLGSRAELLGGIILIAIGCKMVI